MKLPDDVIERITRQASDLFSQGQQARDDVRQNLRSLIQAQLSKLDVVSREEFDAQQAVLERTRAQLDKLEQRLSEIEADEEKDAGAS